MEIKLPMLLDGAMGTMLQKAGMKPGTIPETLNITDPETVAEIHRMRPGAVMDLYLYRRKYDSVMHWIPGR